MLQGENTLRDIFIAEQQRVKICLRMETRGEGGSHSLYPVWVRKGGQFPVWAGGIVKGACMQAWGELLQAV